MKDSCKKLLKLVYNHTQRESRPLQISAYGDDIGYDNPHSLANDIRWLEQNDYLTSPMSMTRSYVLELTEKGEHFVENNFQNSSKSSQAVFNFENMTINNAIIGSQSSAVLNVGDSLQDIWDKIESSNSDDKAELRQIISLLEMIVQDQVPAKKGLFSKFSAVMERNSWITSSISSILLTWLTHL